MAEKRKLSTDIDEISRKKKHVTKQSTKSIYITSLPNTVTIKELENVFSRFGIIAEDVNGIKKIKLYHDEQGNLKGDALITYFKPESVQLAVKIMDGGQFESGTVKSTVEVSPATFNSENTHSAVETETREQAEKIPVIKSTLSNRQKHKLAQRRQLLNQKLQDWDDENEGIKTVSDRWASTVILKNVFDENDVKDSDLIEDIRLDIEEGCSEIGPVKRVVIYDLETEGVVSVKFENVEDALKCVDRMNGRLFDGRKLEAQIYDGIVTYQRTKGGVDEQERLEKFGEWLDNDEHEGDDIALSRSKQGEDEVVTRTEDISSDI